MVQYVKLIHVVVIADVYLMIWCALLCVVLLHCSGVVIGVGIDRTLSARVRDLGIGSAGVNVNTIVVVCA